MPAGSEPLPNITIMHVNMQGLLSSLAELTACIRLLARPPDIVCINETFLNDSIGNVELEGFVTVGRRDRRGGEKCGGVIVFARNDIASHVTLMEKSETSERMWLQMHSNIGPYLLCCWYRPPVQGEVDSIKTFADELQRLREQALGVIILGDLNLHSQRWLTFSAGNTNEAGLMREICMKEGLRQLLREPTQAIIFWT